MPVFNQKFTRCPERQNTVTHTWEKRKSIEADLELAQVLDLLHYTFQVVIINTF